MSYSPMVKVDDVMQKFKVSKNTAIKIMQNEELHSFYLGTPLYCKRECFDAYINKLNDIGWKTYGGGVRTKRAPLLDTLAPVIKINDIKNIFKVCTGTAKKIMGCKQLCSYRPTPNLFVCEQQYLNDYISELTFGGGIRNFGLITSYTTKISDGFNSALSFLQNVCTDEEFERIINYGINEINFPQY